MRPSSSLSPTVASSTSPATAAATAPTPASAGAIVESFASGYSELTFVTNAGDGSDDVYVVEQAGRIFRLKRDAVAPGDAFLDISGRISAGGERGLLGLAFHPDFTSERRVFVDYTNADGDTVISQFTVGSDGSADPASERVLLTVDQPFPNHNGGMLAFGPDGYLYIGLGDGGSGGDPQGNGQNTHVLLAKILRIDVDVDVDADVDGRLPYGIPSDNPFAADPGAGQPEIWDWGLRNPWRFSFDRQSGALFIGDVGQNAWEEVDVEPAGDGGRNYGWNIMEASHCYGATSCATAGLTKPVVDYSHSDGCSVTGGYVYRGSRFPDLVGRYFFADLCSRTVWTIDAAAALAGDSVTPEVFGELPFSPSSFGEDEAGEIFVVDHSGAVYTLVDPS